MIGTIFWSSAILQESHSQSYGNFWTFKVKVSNTLYTFYCVNLHRVQLDGWWNQWSNLINSAQHWICMRGKRIQWWQLSIETCFCSTHNDLSMYYIRQYMYSCLKIERKFEYFIGLECTYAFLGNVKWCVLIKKGNLPISMKLNRPLNEN